MRMKERERSREFALRVVDQCNFAVLSTADAEGQPYGVALSMVRIGENLYFHCAREGRKIDNLRANAKVSVTCVGNIWFPPDEFTVKYESAVVTGTAEEVTEEEEWTQAILALCRRFTPAKEAEAAGCASGARAVTAIWKIKIAEITGKCSPLPEKNESREVGSL